MCGISTVCAQLGLTFRAVRFYEERGLIRSSRDRLNCRRYDAVARERLGKIAEYRRAGLSLEDIVEVFARETDGEPARRQCLAGKLRARLAEIEASRVAAEALLQRVTDAGVMSLSAARRAGAGRR